MKSVLALLLSAAVINVVVSQEDPTESLSGVYDLSELHSILCSIILYWPLLLPLKKLCSSTLVPEA